jgi:hypothetical protein
VRRSTITLPLPLLLLIIISYWLLLTAFFIAIATVNTIITATVIILVTAKDLPLVTAKDHIAYCFSLLLPLLTLLLFHCHYIAIALPVTVDCSLLPISHHTVATG